MEQNAFDYVTQKVGEVLQERGFSQVKNTAAEKDKQSVVFAGDDLAYGIVYQVDKKRFELKKCGMTDEGPDKKWKSVSVWLFDPETDSKDQLQDIVNDFTDSVAGQIQKAVGQAQKKKRRKDDDNNVDTIFFFNRFVGIFPELKDELNDERSLYGQVRSVTFAREKLLPKIEELCTSGGNTSAVNRCATLLSEMYVSGDLDVRSIITIVLLNGLSERAVEALKPNFSQELAKAHKSALKMKGKKVKPEKKKKRSQIMAATLNEMDRR
ncbi:MAG: DUF4304 domain-containing protein [Thermocaproicibacter melissae]|uniref:DUF7674 family protein n=1 Tax=Thermocaproicibacter melissae TaxID=2966552 RepID=UPI003A0FD46E